MGIAICLIALALGYKVFTDACKEKEGLKILGQIIGIFVMIASVLCAACPHTWNYGHSSSCYGRSDCYGMRGSDCPMMKKSTCPITGKVIPSDSSMKQ